MVVVSHSDCTKYHQSVHFKIVNFTLCKFHFNSKKKIKNGSGSLVHLRTAQQDLLKLDKELPMGPRDPQADVSSQLFIA